MAETRREILLTILGVASAIVGMVFLAISSFSEKQFVGNQRLQSVILIIFTGLFVVCTFVGKWIHGFLETVCNWHFSMKAVVQCVSFVLVYVMVFLIKYPRFNIHLALTTSCVQDERKEISHGSQFNLFSVGAFSFVALLLSSGIQKPIELGFFSWLLGLTIGTSMEILGRDGPNLWYVFGAALYCILSIFLRHCVESKSWNSFVASMMSEEQSRIFRYLLLQLSAAFGIFFLFLSPFIKDQFGDKTTVLKVSFFIIFALLLGNFLSQAPEFIGYLANQCDNNRLVKAMVNSFLLMIVSCFIFLTKYPRFQIHMKHKESCIDQKKEKNLPHGSQFNLYSAAAFSLYALTISLEKDGCVKLGIFDFLLELTMDASIETMENKASNLCYMIGAAVYCVVLIFTRIFCLAPAVPPKQNSDGGRSSSDVAAEGRQLERRIQVDPAVRDHQIVASAENPPQRSAFRPLPPARGQTKKRIVANIEKPIEL